MLATRLLSLLALAPAILASGTDFCDNFEPGVQECTSVDNCTLTTVDYCVQNPFLAQTRCASTVPCTFDSECPTGLTCESDECGLTYISIFAEASNCTGVYVNGTCSGGFCSNYNASVKPCVNSSDCIVTQAYIAAIALPTTYNRSCGVSVDCATDADCPNELPCNPSGYCSLDNAAAANCLCPYLAPGNCQSCGNGVLNSTSEECDDFNWDNGDGCDEFCVCESITATAGTFWTESPGVCVEGDSIVLLFNYTVGENYTEASSVTCHSTDGTFEGACVNRLCACEITVSLADMTQLALGNNVSFSMDILVVNSACPSTTNLTLSDSVELGLLPCDCSPVSRCNDISTTTSVLYPLIALGLLCFLILAGIFVSRRRDRHHHHHHHRYNVMETR